MNGVYGGLLFIIVYPTSSVVIEDLFLYLDGTPFGLLDGDNLRLL